ncbi:MAG: TonB-dependent receptor, partial [Muribaculaceae bacterium]|nr:TonB-dependent receptor [Muribaculaceae bacterium]
MGEFLSYSIVSGLSLFTLFLVYRFMLARDNQPAFNRKVLLFIYLVSFVCMPLMFHLIEKNDAATQHVITLEDIEVAGEARHVHEPVWATVLIWGFITGMLIVASKTLLTWVRLINVIVRGEKIRKKNFTLVITDVEEQSPFSWMRYVVIGEKDNESENSVIIVHEVKHVMSRHWIDLLLAQIVCIINWFNPAAWLMREELMLVHEYEADDAVIESGVSRDEYQILLIKKAVGSRFPSLANSLNHSKIKKRITMMCNENSGAGCK